MNPAKELEDYPADPTDNSDEEYESETPSDDFASQFKQEFAHDIINRQINAELSESARPAP